MANYMIVGAKQLGCEIFEVHNGKMTVSSPFQFIDPPLVPLQTQGTAVDFFITT